MQLTFGERQKLPAKIGEMLQALEQEKILQGIRHVWASPYSDSRVAQPK